MRTMRLRWDNVSDIQVRTRDFPVQEPTRYELVVNPKTAKSMAITIPQAVLARADDVIE